MPVWQALQELAPRRVAIVAGSQYFDPSVVTDPRTPHLVLVSNWFLAGRRLLIQRLPLCAVLAPETVIAEMNPRIVTTWAVLVLRRAIRRRTVLWGHAYSHWRPAGSPSTGRRLMRRLANAVVVYTESEAKELRAAEPYTSVIVASNASLRRSEMGARDATSDVTDFVYVGRLVEAKKPALLVRAFVDALPRLPVAAKLVIVGDGPERPGLERLARQHGVESRVRFLGHVSDLEALRDVYRGALASVSPGYVGLSLIQSLSFGVPMIIADDEPHSPEVEAAIPGENMVWFRADTVSDLAATLVDMSNSAARWLAGAEGISARCRQRYSVDAVAERLLEAAELASVVDEPVAPGVAGGANVCSD